MTQVFHNKTGYEIIQDYYYKIQFSVGLTVLKINTEFRNLCWFHRGI